MLRATDLYVEGCRVWMEVDDAECDKYPDSTDYRMKHAAHVLVHAVADKYRYVAPDGKKEVVFKY